MDKQTKAAFLVALGGAASVAKAIGRSKSSVHNWAMDDRIIPWRHRPALARLAAERAVDLPTGFWGEA